MSHFSPALRAKAEATVALYPKKRSALIPLCHLAQGQDGYLTEAAMVEIGELCEVTAAEVRGTATFYDMLHTEPVGRYVVAVCTNIACLLNGASELLEHAEGSLGIGSGGTTADGVITLEEAECLADCDRAPCVQVNHRYVGAQTPESFDQLVADLRSGGRNGDIPPHGTLVRVRRTNGLSMSPGEVAEERKVAADARAARDAAKESAKDASAGGGS